MAGLSQWLARTRLIKPLVFMLCLVPAAWLVVGVFTDTLGANPAEALVRASGDWTLRLLCVALAVTPLRVWTGIAALGRYRRMLGLFVFAYATLHLACYAFFDMGLVAADIARDIAKRPFILIGFAAFMGLALLALTSSTRAVRALGARRWQTLHKSVYGIVLLGLLHLLWLRSGKQHYEDVLLYTAVLTPLLGWRAWRWLSSLGWFRAVGRARAV